MNEDRIMDKQVMSWQQSGMPGRPWPLPWLTMVLLASAVMLSGCGSDGGANGGGNVVAPPPPAPAPVAMVLGEVYEVDDGARLVNRNATPSRIEVRHEIIDGQRFVILREGAADLHR
jgi:hypothetical protein